MRCEVVREQLPAYLDLSEPDLSIRRHLSRCEECREDLARLDTLRRQTRQMAVTVAEPPPHLLQSLESIASSVDKLTSVKGHVRRNRKAYIGGVAVIAGAAGAAVLLRRKAA